MNLDKQTLQAFRNDFNKIAEVLETKYGVKMEMGTIRYGSDNFSFKTEVAILGVAGEKVSDEAAAKIIWDQNCSTFGLKKEMFGRKIRLGSGEVGEIIKLEPRKYKYPVIVRSGSKQYKLPAAGIAAKLIDNKP